MPFVGGHPRRSGGAPSGIDTRDLAPDAGNGWPFSLDGGRQPSPSKPPRGRPIQWTIWGFSPHCWGNAGWSPFLTTPVPGVILLAPKSGVHLSPTESHRRSYDSPLRRQRAAETRDRIVAAGTDLLHSFPIWNWRALTVRAVAERAGVNERTVYRHFANERELRDAVLARLEQESGVDLEGLSLDAVVEMTRRMFAYVSSFPLEPRTPRDPTVAAANERQRRALTAAVAPHTEDWTDHDRTVAAAMLDVLWSVVSYERLVADWGLEPEEAIKGIGWAIGLVGEAIRSGAPPA